MELLLALNGSFRFSVEGDFGFAVRLCPFPFCFEVLLFATELSKEGRTWHLQFFEVGLCQWQFGSRALPRSALPSCEFASRTLPVCFAQNFALCYRTKNSTNFCYRTWKNSVEILVGIRKISRTDFKNNSYGFSNLSCTDSKIFLILYESSGDTNHIHSSNYQMHIYRHHLL